MANVQKDFSEISQNYSRTFDGPTKNFVPEFDFFLPMFRKKIQNWNLFKRYDSKNFFPWIGKYQLRHSCWLPFLEVWKFLLTLRINASMQNNFFAKKLLGKMLRSRKVQFWKRLKNFLRCPNFYRSNTENKHKLTTFPKLSPPN